MMKNLLKVLILGVLAINLAQAREVKIYIMHGFNPNPAWFSWLKSELSSQTGGEIKAENIAIPRFPLDKPSLNAWKNRIRQVVGRTNENMYFVAHNASGNALLKYLDENNFKIGGLIIINGFDKPIPHVAQLNNFALHNIDYKKLASQIRHIAVISSRDDKVIPHKFSESLANNLGAKFILEQKSSHFRHISPRTVYNEIKSMVKDDE